MSFVCWLFLDPFLILMLVVGFSLNDMMTVPTADDSDDSDDDDEEGHCVDGI